MKNIRSYISVIIAFMVLALPVTLTGQEEATPVIKKVDKPVRSPWAAGTLIESQSYRVFTPKTLVFVMQHRFDMINNPGGEFNLLGIYGAANIRMGLQYGLAKNLEIGIGTTKENMLQDLNWKYSILRQTRSGKIPIALTYYGNVQIDVRKEENFGAEYQFSHRLAYFNQLLIGRKLSKKMSLQLMLNHAHYNQIDSTSITNLDHTNFGVGIAGRFKFTPQTSALIEYHHPLTTPETIKANLSFGVEVSTSTHTFQIFVTNYKSISYQRNLMFNQNDPGAGDFMIGFNITRNWNF